MDELLKMRLDRPADPPVKGIPTISLLAQPFFDASGMNVGNNRNQ